MERKKGIKRVAVALFVLLLTVGAVAAVWNEAGARDRREARTAQAAQTEESPRETKSRHAQKMPTTYIVPLTLCGTVVGESGSWVIGDTSFGVYAQAGSSEGVSSCVTGYGISGIGGVAGDWSVTPDASPPTEATVIVPDGTGFALPATLIYLDGEVEGFPDRTNVYSGAFGDPSGCTCTPTATPTPENLGESGYDLRVTLDEGDCTLPLASIVWDPEPTTGQGTDEALYEARGYGDEISGTCTVTDDDGCIGVAEWTHIQEACTCTPVATTFVFNEQPSTYDLELSLDANDCIAPFQSIVWTPTPDSGQGSGTVVYLDRAYGTPYTGSVATVDANGCTGSADWSEQQPSDPPPPPPPCTCDAAVIESESNIADGLYDLTTNLTPGTCAVPLDNIQWAPAPDSGQGTLTATYEGLAEDTDYGGVVSGTDADGCTFSAAWTHRRNSTDPPCTCGVDGQSNFIDGPDSFTYCVLLTPQVQGGRPCVFPLTVEWTPAPSSGANASVCFADLSYAVWQGGAWSGGHTFFYNITDANGCTLNGQIDILKPRTNPPCNCEIVLTKAVTVVGADDYDFTVTAAPGGAQACAEPLLVSWSPTPSSVSSDTLTATYQGAAYDVPFVVTASAVDANGCTATETTSSNEPGGGGGGDGGGGGGGGGTGGGGAGGGGTTCDDCEGTADDNDCPDCLLVVNDSWFALGSEGDNKSEISIEVRNGSNARFEDSADDYATITIAGIKLTERALREYQAFLRVTRPPRDTVLVRDLRDYQIAVEDYDDPHFTWDDTRTNKLSAFRQPVTIGTADGENDTYQIVLPDTYQCADTARRILYPDHCYPQLLDMWGNVWREPQFLRVFVKDAEQPIYRWEDEVCEGFTVGKCGGTVAFETPPAAGVTVGVLGYFFKRCVLRERGGIKYLGGGSWAVSGNLVFEEMRGEASTPYVAGT